MFFIYNFIQQELELKKKEIQEQFYLNFIHNFLSN